MCWSSLGLLIVPIMHWHLVQHKHYYLNIIEHSFVFSSVLRCVQGEAKVKYNKLSLLNIGTYFIMDTSAPSEDLELVSILKLVNMHQTDQFFGEK